jgi:hypothetical protein
MSGLVGDRKRNIRKKCALLIGLLALLVLPAGAEQKQKNSNGVYTGWSFSLGEEFIEESPGGHTTNHYMPNLILGAYWQHNFSGLFGLQFNVNLQNCSDNSEFNYYNRHEEGMGFIGCFSFSLNGIATVSRTAMTEYYLLGGIGVFTGPFDYHKSFLQFSGGTGVKLRGRPGSRTSVNLAVIFHHLLYHNFQYDYSRHANYLRLQAGLEFLPKDKQDNLVE